MAISPWTKPLEMKIAPLPFEALAYGYEKRQKRQDEAETLLSGLEDDFLKVKALPVDKPKRDAIIKSYRDSVSNLYNETKGDVLKMAPAVKDLQRKLKYETTYGDLADINSKAVEYEKLSTDFAKADMDNKFGGLSNYMRKYAIDLPLEQYTAQGGHARNEAGVSNPVGWRDLSQLPNVGEKMSEWVTKFKAERYAGKTLVPTPDGRGYLVKEDNEIVPYDEIALNAMQWALNNPDFTKVNEVIGSLVPEDYTADVAVGFDREKNQFVTEPMAGPVAGLYDFYKSSISSLANREAYTKSYTTMYKDWEKAMSMKQQMATPTIEPQTFKSTYVDWRNISNPYKDAVTEEGKANFLKDASGNLIIDVAPVIYQDMGPDQIKEAQARANLTTAKNKELKAKFDRLRKTVRGTENLSDEQLAKFMNDAYTNSKMAFDVYDLPDFNYKELAPQVFGDLVNQPVYQTSEEGSSKNTFAAIAKDLGYEPLELKTIIMEQAKNGNLRLAPFTPLDRPGYSVEIASKKGKPVNLIIGSSQEMTRHFQWLYPVYDMLKKGQVGYSTNKVYNDDYGIYTNIGYENGQPFWYVSRVLNKENSDKMLKNLGLTREQAEAQGIKFSPSGGMHVNDINDIIKDNTTNWLNGKYMKPFRTSYSKNIYDIAEESPEQTPTQE